MKASVVKKLLVILGAMTILATFGSAFAAADCSNGGVYAPSEQTRAAWQAVCRKLPTKKQCGSVAPMVPTTCKCADAGCMPGPFNRNGYKISGTCTWSSYGSGFFCNEGELQDEIPCACVPKTENDNLSE